MALNNDNCEKLIAAFGQVQGNWSYNVRLDEVKKRVQGSDD